MRQSRILELLQGLGRAASQRTNFERTCIRSRSCSKLEGVEKNELYKAFRLPQLAEQIAAAIQSRFPRSLCRPRLTTHAPDVPHIEFSNPRKRGVCAQFAAGLQKLTAVKIPLILRGSALTVQNSHCSWEKDNC
jgi:hypothetical protein